MSSFMYPNLVVKGFSGEFDIGTDDVKVALFNSSYTPSKTHVNFADLGANQLAEGEGYLTGGVIVTCSVSYDETVDKAAFVSSSPEWTANGGSIGPWRYAVWYNDTQLNKPLIYCFDAGSDITVTDGNKTGVNVAVAGLFRIG